MDVFGVTTTHLKDLKPGVKIVMFYTQRGGLHSAKHGNGEIVFEDKSNYPQIVVVST
jgi:hypothetical protein